MPILGKGGFFTLRLYNCRSWQTLPDLTTALYGLRERSQLSARTQSVTHSKQPARLLAERSDFESYCVAKYRESEDWDQEHFVDVFAQGKLRLQFVPPFTIGDPDWERIPVHLLATKFGDEYNFIQFLMLISARTIPASDITAKYRENIMQLYVDIGHYLIEVLSPDYLWIAEDDEYLDHLDGRDILAHRVNVIYWANYFSPDYLDEYTQSLFLNAPVGFPKYLGAGIWYQLHEQFETVDAQTAERIEAEATSWFSKLALDRVQWRFE